MPNVYESSVVGAPAPAVWETIRDFGGLDEWYPGIEPEAIDLEGDKDGDAVGAVRVLRMPGDVTVREKLVEHSDYQRSYTYTILDYPLPLTDYHATLGVRAVTDTDEALVEWSSRFEIEPDLRDETVDNITTVYREGLDALTNRFG